MITQQRFNTTTANPPEKENNNCKWNSRNVDKR